MANPSNFPNRPFRLEAYTWLNSQNVAANTSNIGYSLWIKKNSYSPTASGATSSWNFWVNGVQVNANTFTYNFSNSDELQLVLGTVTIPHNNDGTATVAYAGNVVADILGAATADGSWVLPTIPRASVASISAPFTRDIGSPVTLNLNPAAGSFRHTLIYAFGSKVAQPIASNVESSYEWTPPLSLLEEIPNATSAIVTIGVTTFSGGTQIGYRQSQFTLAAGVGIVPTISSLSVVDNNPDVASVVGKFVQGLSILKGTVNAAGVYGSTIAAREFTMGATTVASGEAIPVTQSGTVSLTAKATDTRGRVAIFAGSLAVLPYENPLLSLVLVRRCDPGGTVNDNGTSLRVDLKAAVSSLMNTTQRNQLTIRVFTRPYGGSTWTPRNTINHSAVTYDSSFVVSGGANYPIDDSFDVRVEVSDKFNTAAAQTIVATSAIFMHWSKTGVGVGKFHEQGALDVAGDIYQSGNAVIDASDAATTAAKGIAELATQAEVNAGSDATRIVTPSMLRNRAYGAWSEAAGEITAAQNTTGNTVITFPAGRFTQPPNLQVTIRAYLPNAQVLVRTVSATQATVDTFNVSNGANITGLPFHWSAKQMTSSSASG